MIATISGARTLDQTVRTIRPDIKKTIYDPAEIAGIRHSFGELCTEAGVSDEIEKGMLTLALGEAAANAVSYGGEGVIVAFVIGVSVSPKWNRIVLTVSSPLPEGKVLRDCEEMPEESAIHGRGLPLIHQAMDEVAIYDEDGRHTLIMTKEVSA